MAWTPNLIIPGVAKCGTTTIYDLLMAHPRITGGIEKEVRFLMDEDDGLCPKVNIRDCGLEAWKTLYNGRGSGDFDIWVDASPQYQFQATALETIAGLNPQPKVLLIVRQPSRRLFSLYQYARYHQRALPHIRSFGHFIEEVRDPEGTELSNQKMMITAWTDSQYDLMLNKWSAILDPQNLFVTSIEELGASRQAVLEAMAEWMSIDPAGWLNTQVERSNPTVVTKSKFVRKTGARLAKLLPDNSLVRSLKTFARELNSAPIDRNEFAENAGLLAQLDEEFAENMSRFEALRDELDLTLKA